jgi:hypothetical protein
MQVKWSWYQVTNVAYCYFLLFFPKPSNVVIFQIILPDSLSKISFPSSDVVLTLFELATMHNKIKAPHFTCNDHVEIHGII